MPKHRVSLARQLRQLHVRTFGRLPAGRPPRVRPDPTYRKVTAAEVLRIHAWAALGWSARRIARQVTRDHHTVCRWLLPAKAARRLLRPPTVEHLREAARMAHRVTDATLRSEVLQEIEQARRDRQAQERLGWGRRVGILTDSTPGGAVLRRMGGAQ